MTDKYITHYYIVFLHYFDTQIANIFEKYMNFSNGNFVLNAKTLAIRTTVVPIRILIRTTVVPIRILIRTTVVPIRILIRTTGITNALC